MSAGGSSAGTSGQAGSGVTAVCPDEAPPQEGKNNVVWTLPLDLRSKDRSLVLGDELTRSDGRAYKVSLLKFFLAEPVVLDANEGRVHAQFLDANSKPLPYGITLIDADADNTLRLAVPAGSYAGLELGVGLPAACNAGDPTRRIFPLSADGDMYWTWGAQYMFIRIEGQLRANDAWSTFTDHFGFDPFYRVVKLKAELDLRSPTSMPATLVFDLDAFLTPPTGVVEAASPVTPPDWMLQNLESRTFSLTRPGP